MRMYGILRYYTFKVVYFPHLYDLNRYSLRSLLRGSKTSISHIRTSYLLRVLHECELNVIQLDRFNLKKKEENANTGNKLVM